MRSLRSQAPRHLLSDRALPRSLLYAPTLPIPKQSQTDPTGYRSTAMVMEIYEFLACTCLFD